MKLILFDGDILRYRCGFAAQKTVYHIAGETFDSAKACDVYIKQRDLDVNDREAEIIVEPVQNALHNVKHVVAEVAELWPDYHPVMYVSCSTPDNWRTQFYPEYKANRKDARKPVHGPAIDEYMRAKWDVMEHPTKEADDLIAEQAYSNSYQDCVVVSIDKDLLQIPCTHYNWVQKVTTLQDGMTAMVALAAQRVSGDSTDNIKGIPGYGDKTASKALENSDVVDLEEAIRNIYRTATNRQGSQVYKDVLEAEYHMALTTALVTLPVNDEHQARLVQEVKDAEDRYKKSPSYSDDNFHTSGSTG